MLTVVEFVITNKFLQLREHFIHIFNSNVYSKVLIIITTLGHLKKRWNWMRLKKKSMTANSHIQANSAVSNLPGATTHHILHGGLGHENVLPGGWGALLCLAGSATHSTGLCRHQNGLQNGFEKPLQDFEAAEDTNECVASMTKDWTRKLLMGGPLPISANRPWRYFSLVPIQHKRTPWCRQLTRPAQKSDWEYWIKSSSPNATPPVWFSRPFGVPGADQAFAAGSLTAFALGDLLI